jgi:hypothetical protein
MHAWTSPINYDPKPPLESSQNVAIACFVEWDLLDHETGSINLLWDLPEVRKIIRKQQADGSGFL